jgi:hypothetical protein
VIRLVAQQGRSSYCHAGPLLLSADPVAPALALLRCPHYSPASARVFAANVQLTAIKVGTLTLQ